jgi:hypothetical protein
VVASRTAPDGQSVASVRLAACGSAWCESLWIGTDGAEGTRIATLTGTDRATEVVWAPDGSRVAIVVNGHQLRVYDVVTRAPAGQLDLVPADGPPTTRIARGITFSDNGAAITFDDCPRDRSGCRPGIAALRY